MDRLGVCVVGVCCVGFGLFAGMAISMAYTPTPEDVIAERDRLRAKCNELADSVDLERQHKEAAQADVDRAFQDLVKADKTTQLTKKCHQKVVDDWLKANALIHMILSRQAEVLIRKPGFDEKFAADWYQPKLAYKELGGRWFVRELHQCGLVTDEEMETITAIWRKNDVEKWNQETP